MRRIKFTLAEASTVMEASGGGEADGPLVTTSFYSILLQPITERPRVEFQQASRLFFDPFRAFQRPHQEILFNAVDQTFKIEAVFRKIRWHALRLLGCDRVMQPPADIRIGD